MKAEGRSDWRFVLPPSFFLRRALLELMTAARATQALIFIWRNAMLYFSGRSPALSKGNEPARGPHRRREWQGGSAP